MKTFVDLNSGKYDIEYTHQNVNVWAIHGEGILDLKRAPDDIRCFAIGLMQGAAGMHMALDAEVRYGKVA